MLDMVDRRPSILHINLQNAKTRRSYRQDVSDETISVLLPLVQADGDHMIPRIEKRHLLVTRHGGLLLATVSAENPICSIGVANQTVGAQKLWEMLHENVKTATSLDRPPSAPWCAIRPEMGLADYPNDLDWLADFEACLAWTWVEARRPKPL
jgi:hypothetical protein